MTTGRTTDIVIIDDPVTPTPEQQRRTVDEYEKLKKIMADRGIKLGERTVHPPKEEDTPVIVQGG